MALSTGLYRKRFSSQTSSRKFNACATTVYQSISMAYLPAAVLITWFQKGFAKIRIIEITKQ